MSRCYKLSLEEQKQYEELDNQEAKIAFLEELSRKTSINSSFQRENIENIPEQVSVPNVSKSPAEHLENILFNPTILQSWEEELEGVSQVTSTNREIVESLWTPKNIILNNAMAESRWISGTDETRQESLKDNNLDKNKFVTPWEELSDWERAVLSLDEIPDHSLKKGLWDEIVNIDYLMQYFEQDTGIPFLSLSQRIQQRASLSEIVKDLSLRRISTDPHFHSFIHDEKAWEKLTSIMEARYKGEPDPKSTDEELLCVDALQEVYDSFKPTARYLRVLYKAGDTLESFKNTFPDAVEDGKESELVESLRLKEEGDLKALWVYLEPLDWGVIKFGYDPRKIADFSLRTGTNNSLRRARGRGILESRTSEESPEEALIPSPFMRLESYVEDISIQALLSPELDRLHSMWKLIKNKYDINSQRMMQTGLNNWQDRIQHRKLEFSKADMLIRKLWLQQMKAVFWRPDISIRNLFQGFVLGTDRLEVAKAPFVPVPADIKIKNKLYFDTFSSQMGGVRKDITHTGSTIWGYPNPMALLNPLNRLADKLTWYDWSDYIPRHNTFNAAYNKASAATTQYLKDGNLKKWISKSGILHMRLPEKNYVLTHFIGQIDKVFDTGVDGLHSLKGADMANYYVAQGVTNIVNFPMKRDLRGLMEMGVSGQTMWQLSVYPRGYAQRVVLQAEKIKQAFNKDTTWEDARGGFNDLLKLFIFSGLVGAGWCAVTGKNKNPFDVISTLTGWQYGGMLVGTATNFFDLVRYISAYLNPATSSEERKTIANQLPTLITETGTMIPFYTTVRDILEALTGIPDIDKQALRELRSWFSGGTYTPDEIDKAQRNLWEMIQKIIFSATDPEPEFLKEIQTDLSDAENNLGKVDNMSGSGQFYTLIQLGNLIDSKTKELPGIYFTKDDGFSDLTVFYLECKDSWTPYYNLLTVDEKINWLKSHPEEEAMMRFWGKKSKSVFTQNSEGGKIEANLLSIWTSVYGITESSEPSADWQDFVKLPE